MPSDTQRAKDIAMLLGLAKTASRFDAAVPPGTPPRSSTCLPASVSLRFRPAALNSIRWKTPGSTCETTGYRTPSSSLTTTSSANAAPRGTSSSSNPPPSPQSGCGSGRMGFSQRDLVLGAQSSGVRTFVAHQKSRASSTGAGRRAVSAPSLRFPEPIPTDRVVQKLKGSTSLRAASMKASATSWKGAASTLDCDWSSSIANSR